MLQPFLIININSTLILSNIIGTGAPAHCRFDQYKGYWRADLTLNCIRYVQAVAKKRDLSVKQKLATYADHKNQYHY